MKISIIVPVYNTSLYLRDCLKSVFEQTIDSMEVILINDGSTDNSLSILEEYSAKFPDIVKLISKENGGQGMARNIGIDMSSGDYIGFVDSDDYIDKQMFEDMYNIAKQNDSDCVECDYDYVKVSNDNQLVSLKPYGNVREYKDKKDMFKNPLVSPWNKLYKSEIIKKNSIYFPEGVIYEDTSFFIKTIPYIDKFSFIDKKYVKHFYRQKSTMNVNKGKRVADIFKVLDNIIDYYDSNNLMEIYKEEIEYFCTKILMCSSLKRIATINDVSLKKELLDVSWNMINNRFSNFKSNKYMKDGKINLYMKTMNRRRMGIYCRLFALLGRVK